MHLRTVVLILGLSMALPVWAGDEDVPVPKPEPIPEVSEPEQPPAPPEDFPDLSLGESDKSVVEPEVVPQAPPTPPPPPTMRRVVRYGRKPFRRMNTDPDENLDSSRTTTWVRRTPLPKGVLRPSLGTRGYRSSMIAVGFGDRTPGYGVQVEHSFNRVGVGVSASYLPLTGDLRSESYSIYNLYGIYRWLPFSISPYIHGGIQYGQATPISFGLLGGVGLEARVYDQWTVTTGYTFHSIAEKGYWGGSIGWIF